MKAMANFGPHCPDFRSARPLYCLLMRVSLCLPIMLWLTDSKKYEPAAFKSSGNP